jgi:lipoprotein-releasing system ATP-binding protein
MDAHAVLVADGLTKIYGTVAPTTALQDVSFTIGRGEFAAVIGQSGSGKSTLLNLLGLLDTPTQGRVLLLDQDTSALRAVQRAQLRSESIGFVFQFHHLLPEFSVLENVLLPSLIRAGGRATADDTLRANAEETLALLGLSGLEGKGADQLSGGQKQRVAIARALMNRPALILADEPTGNLDTVNTAAVYGLFRTINAELGTTFLIVTHDRAIAQQTDRILEVVDGQLVQDVRNPYADPPAGAIPDRAATDTATEERAGVATDTATEEPEGRAPGA